MQWVIIVSFIALCFILPSLSRPLTYSLHQSSLSFIRQHIYLSFFRINVYFSLALSFNSSLPVIYLFLMLPPFSLKISYFFVSSLAVSISFSSRLLQYFLPSKSITALIAQVKLVHFTLFWPSLPFNTFIPHNFIKPSYSSLILCPTFSIS